MPAPLNFIHREFAADTREPAARFADGMARLYGALSSLEREDLQSAETQLRSASELIEGAAQQMTDLHSVEARWQVVEPELFRALIARVAALVDAVPPGDRALIDLLVVELRALAALARPPASLPTDPEQQSQLIGRILRQAGRSQELGLLATEISLVTAARH